MWEAIGIVVGVIVKMIVGLFGKAKEKSVKFAKYVYSVVTRFSNNGKVANDVEEAMAELESQTENAEDQ